MSLIKFYVETTNPQNYVHHHELKIDATGLKQGLKYWSKVGREFLVSDLFLGFMAGWVGGYSSGRSDAKK